MMETGAGIEMTIVNALALLFAAMVIYYGYRLRGIGGAVGKSSSFNIGGGIALALVFIGEALRMDVGLMIMGDQWHFVHWVLMAVAILLIALGSRQIAQLQSG